MGMFAKDKEIGLILQKYVPKRAEFVLWDAEVTREDFPTDLGPAAQATLAISSLTRDPEGTNKTLVTTLASAIVDKVREATREDFPAVVYWTTVTSAKFGREATVLQFVREHTYPGMKSSPQPGGTVESPADPSPAEDEIPF